MRLGLAATAGAGKTMGALLVAYGLTGDWGKVGLADTENGSGELYVGHTVPGTNIVIGEYMYARIDAPFTVQKYMQAQAALEDAECAAIIIDSTSHAWAGAGGLLDKQGKIAAKSGNSYTAWRDVTPEHNAFIEMMLQSPAHIIATMRSKTEYVLETNDKGKQVPRKIGMAPVQREGMDFEFTVVLDIDQSHIASASKDRTSLFDGEYFKLSPDVGKKMLAWLNAGAEPCASEMKLVAIQAKARQLLADLDAGEHAEMKKMLVEAFSFAEMRLGGAEREAAA
jgi:predicted nucleotidyltransferase